MAIRLREAARMRELQADIQIAIRIRTEAFDVGIHQRSRSAAIAGSVRGVSIS